MVLGIMAVVLAGLAVTPITEGRGATPDHPGDAAAPAAEVDLVSDLGPQVAARARLLTDPSPPRLGPASFTSLARMSRSKLRDVIDGYWGEGAPTAEKLAIFDKFWKYADVHYAGFQGTRVDWRAERRRYRDEVAAGVSRGRFAAIMNQLSLALHDSHSIALDEPVNVNTRCRTAGYRSSG
jgi:hypothetical protein